jgi:hypothetical protein
MLFVNNIYCRFYTNFVLINFCAPLKSPTIKCRLLHRLAYRSNTVNMRQLYIVSTLLLLLALAKANKESSSQSSEEMTTEQPTTQQQTTEEMTTEPPLTTISVIIMEGRGKREASTGSRSPRSDESGGDRGRGMFGMGGRREHSGERSGGLLSRFG